MGQRMTGQKADSRTFWGRHYAWVITALCMLMMTTMAVSADTLKSEKLVKYFCVSEENDITFLETDLLAGMFSSPDGYKESLEKADKLLEDCGIDGDCSMMCCTSCDTVHGDKSASNIYYIYIKGESPFKLECNEGSAPQKNDEIAMTRYALDKLGAEIGDKITTTMGDKEYEFIITGTFSTYMGNGYGAFLYKDFDTVAAQLKPMGTAGIQVKLKGDSSEAAIQDAIDKLKIKLDSDKVYTNTEMVKTMTQVSDSLNAVKKLMMVMTIILVFLVIMLMERSFISKEKNDRLYEELLQKHLNGVYKNRINGIGQLLNDGNDTFRNLPVNEQAQVLLEILKISQNVNSGANLVLLGGSASTGVSVISATISKAKSFLLVNDSVTGIFMRATDLLTV